MKTKYLRLAAFLLLGALATGAHAAVQTVTLSVPGMNCPVCPITVKKALTKVEGVQQVNVSLEKREAIVRFDDTKASVDALMDATEAAGYPSSVKK